MSKKTFNPHSRKNQKDRKRRCKRVYIPTASYPNPFAFNFGRGNKNAHGEPKADSVGTYERELKERVKKDNAPKKKMSLLQRVKNFVSRKKGQ